MGTAFLTNPKHTWLVYTGVVNPSVSMDFWMDGMAFYSAVSVWMVWNGLGIVSRTPKIGIDMNTDSCPN